MLGTQARFLCEGRSANSVHSLMEVTLPRDGGPPPHTHAWDEAYFVTESGVQYTVGEQRFTATVGDFVCTQGGVMHGFRGASQQPARVLVFDAPAHAGAFFKRVDHEVTEVPRDLPKVFDISRSTGIRLVLPA